MNSILKSAFLLFSLIFFLIACEKQDGEGEGEMNGKNTFDTPEEAVAKAKSDLIQVLETSKDIDLGIDVEKLRNAEQVRIVQYVEVDFEKLLRTENVQSLSDISSAPKSMVAPFALQNNVVGVVEVREESSKWKVSGLGNKPLTEDFNMAGIANNNEAAVTVYEVPNLQVFVYGVRMGGTETYHLNLGEYTLKDTVNVQAFYPLLRENSIQFQREFGDLLKKEQLLK